MKNVPVGTKAIYFEWQKKIYKAGEVMAKHTSTRENREMRVLSAIGIILVVAGHLGYNLFDIGELFPYYSFHVFIFLFVSGYFYKEESEDNIGGYLLHKGRTLLLPYFAWNLFYGLLTNFLHGHGFSIGTAVLKNNVSVAFSGRTSVFV